jgi:hypothetical protein
MTNNEKAVKRLESLDISAKVDLGSVYIFIGDITLELSEFEINFQADEYDKMVKNGYEF